MIRKPEEIWFNKGIQENKKLAPMDTRTTPAMIRLALDGGMMTAINIPYRATPRALKIRPGSILPERTPKKVPKAQPGEATAMTP